MAEGTGPIVLVMAMRAEAEPVAAKLGLDPSSPAWDARWPAKLWTDKDVCIVQTGQDDRHGVDLVGTQAAVAATMLACEHLEPRLLISAGTAGGFSARGGEIGKVYVAQGHVWYHGRNADLPGFDAVAKGGYACVDLEQQAAEAGLSMGVVSTGDRLDAVDYELKAIEQHGTHAKEMEAAAVAWVAHVWGVPFSAVKSITDIVDGPRSTESEFLEHLHASVGSLCGALGRFLPLLA